MTDVQRIILARYLQTLGVSEEKSWASTYTIEKLLDQND